VTATADAADAAGLDDTARRPVAERLELGRGLRQAVPRGSIADWSPAADRADPVEVLVASNAGRLEELIPIRFGRMAVSPFTFLRGSAAVMARDFAPLPTTGLRTQVCGDCHLGNFGLFATPERHVIFGINDFDETTPGPWEQDVFRLAASFVVGGKDAGHRTAVARQAAVDAVGSYRRHLWKHVPVSPLDTWYEQISLEQEIGRATDAKTKARRRRLLDQARRRVGDQLVPKLVRTEGDAMRIVDQPPLVYHADQGDVPALAAAFLASYRESLPADRRVLVDRYRFVDVAVKVVGVGSVGTRCLVALLVSPGGHPLLLQIKEANASVVATALELPAAEHEGERVVTGQRLMQPVTDIFLGWGTGPSGRHFYVRQLRDMKLSLVLDRDPQVLSRLADYCGRALARAHANSGDAAMLAGYLGRSDRFEEAVGTMAVRYAAQTEDDHARLLDAIAEGRIEAREVA
jgi:uncharacterized protein (DUF2252 family)